MYFCDLENRTAKEVVPGVRVRTFWEEKMLLAVIDFEAGASVPLHSHHHEQVGSVVSGEIELTIAGESRWLKAGDSYIIPGGVEHGARAGRLATRVLDVFSPVREEYKY